MSISHLSEATLRRYADVQVFEQARLIAGAVVGLVRRGSILQAELEG